MSLSVIALVFNSYLDYQPDLVSVFMTSLIKGQLQLNENQIRSTLNDNSYYDGFI
jgi:hypothetical protein